MKKIFQKLLFSVIISCFLVLSVSATATAGTVMVGVKSWTAAWDSWMGNDAVESFPGSSADNGYGMMAGPVIGYQTDDKLWSFSAAFLALNHFTQDITLDMTSIGYPKEDFEAELNRMDFDFAVNYAFNDNFKFFAGYKIQTYDIEFSSSQSPKITIEMTAHMPTIGVGAVYPLMDNLVASGQFGLLYTIPGDSTTKVLGASEKTKMKNKFGFNFELGVNFMVVDNLILQAGFRYQQITIQAKEDDKADDDKFYGLTLGAVYMI